MAITLYAHDSKYGTFTLTYDSTNNVFSGCNVVTIPARALCGQVTGAIKHVFSDAGGFNLTTYFAFNDATQCPIGSNCSSTLNHDGEWQLYSNSCGPPFSVVFDGPDSDLNFLSYNAVSATVTINASPV